MENLGQRLQALRKAQGISQEELAGRLGVSRQAVSKWESGQSLPELDKAVAISEYFGVTADYLLRGIRAQPDSGGKRRFDANTASIIATTLNFLGVIAAVSLWYEFQTAWANAVGLGLMALGCAVFAIGIARSGTEGSARAKRVFLSINVWLLAFPLLSLAFNALTSRQPAPYPLLVNPLIAYPLFWLVYAASCIAITRAVRKGDFPSNAR